MQKVLNYHDNIEGIMIVVNCFVTILHISGKYISKFPLNEHGTQELLTAQNSLNYIYYFLSLLGMILLYKRKYIFLQKIEMILWFILFLLTPYLLHQITSIEQTYSSDRVENLGKNHD